MDQDKLTNSGSPRIAVFVLLQIAAALTVAGIVHGRLETFSRRPQSPAARTAPLSVAPTYDRPEIVSDADLSAVLYKLRPRLAGTRPRINSVDHALRCWGTSADFEDPECLSGVAMRDILLDHRAFARVWGKDEPPLLIADQRGVAVRTKEGSASSSHVDHTLASMGEIGTTLRFPVQLPKGQATLGALLARSLRTFSLNQSEYEWSAMAYALYLDGAAPWVTAEGQEVDFDRLAGRIMREELGLGVCCGQHRLSALVLFLRIDQQRRILSPECRARILEHLGNVSKLLVRSQHPKGYWNREWWTGAPPTAEDNRPGPISPELWRILATSHILEWLALAPQSVHPPEATLVKAGRWLTQTVLKLEDKQVAHQDHYYPPLTHVAMALALWRGRLPGQVLAESGLREGAAPEVASPIARRPAPGDDVRDGTNSRVLCEHHECAGFSTVGARRAPYGEIPQQKERR